MSQSLSTIFLRAGAVRAARSSFARLFSARPAFARPAFARPAEARIFVAVLFAMLFAVSLEADALRADDGFACMPCVGVQVDDPVDAARSLQSDPRLQDGASLHVAWTASAADAPAQVAAVREAGAAPWLRVVFRASAPIAEHLDVLESELRSMTDLVRSIGEEGSTWVQVDWSPAEGAANPADLGYVIKRAAVAVTGVRPATSFAAGPLAADAESLRELYAQEVAAYLDAAVLAPGDDETFAAAVGALTEVDPGKPVVLDAADWPNAPSAALARAARASVAGVRLTFFANPPTTAEALAPLKVLANEMQGDIAYDPTSVPTGAPAWAFVRGDDLSLRVIAEADPGAESLPLAFDDPQLLGPRRFDLQSGSQQSIFDQRRGADGLSMTVENPTPAILVKVRRASIQELEGIDEQIRITDERQMPVEEILRRLQAFEDDQARRLNHYEATNTMHLRFSAGPAGIEASYSGDFFFTRDGFDWVWKDFFIDGVRWKGKKLPEIPLIQPEKVAAAPLEILLAKNYDYRLRGTANVDGRDCWVIDFKPLSVEPGKSLYQGTVWVDREIYARVRTRAIQLGLEGEVLSNEETTFFSPLDPSTGAPSDWSRDNFVLPLRVVGQQTLSVFSATVPVEQELALSNVRINAEGFEQRREEAWDSEFTMVRDTDDGLRYLEKTDEGERVVQTEFDTSRFFLAGGVFWDESLDFPLPLAGVNYLDLDFRDTGSQLNVLFAGPFFTANLSNPSLFGSRWNAGVSATGFLIDRGDSLYRDGVENPLEEIESKGGSVAFFLGRPLGNFWKLDLTYRLRTDLYSVSEDTAEDFILPEDALTQTAVAELIYDRAGWRVALEGSLSERGDWEFWGLPGNTDFSDEQSEYLRYKATVRKTWYLQNFRRFGVELEHLGGEDLDRFSSFDFGIFGDSSVAGYQSGLVRADEANGVHVSYGVNVLDRIRFEIEGDAVWASNEATGLDDELLAGVGLEGTVTTRWWGGLILNFEGGVAVEGPGEGDVAARIVFLKLWDGNPFKRNK